MCGSSAVNTNEQLLFLIDVAFRLLLLLLFTNQINTLLSPGGAIASTSAVGGWSVAVEGPWFTVEPPSRLELNNETGASISCSATGHPTPLVHWVLASSMSDFATHSSSASLSLSSSGPVALGDIPGLRQVLLNANGNATLILHPFPVTSYRPDVHSVSYRCRAASAAGTVLSREMKLRTGKHTQLLFILSHHFVSILVIAFLIFCCSAIAVVRSAGSGRDVCGRRSGSAALFRAAGC